jgi:DNA recombination protein RmuC
MGQSLTETSRKTNDSLSKLYERLAVIDSAQRNLTELSNNVVTLQQILADKQTRGAFGQGRMEAIVMDGLPKDAYTFQATLSNGKRPDCLIKLPNAPALVVDAKFPLEGFEAVRRARTDAAKKEASQRVRQDVTRHIEAIAERYLLPGETQDSGLMFVPSEAIYADLHENFSELLQKAHRARVVVVSPNMLMLAVQTMQAILKDVRMREQAGLIQREVAYLMEDVGRLRERTLDLQRHFGQANQDIEKILTSSEKIGNRGMRIETLDFEADANKAVEAKSKKRAERTRAAKSKAAAKEGVGAKPRGRRNGGPDRLAAGE